MKHQIHEELRGVFLFLSAIWVVFALNGVLPLELNRFGVTPRTLVGLGGIPLMPFLHEGWRHLLSNSVPLFLLLTLMAGSQANTWRVVGQIVVLGGALLWLFGRPATHVGASGLVFGLIAFLIVSGFVERRMLAILVALAVGFLFGGTLLSGILPRFGSAISWEGHLLGAVAGGLIAWRGGDRHGKLPIPGTG